MADSANETPTGVPTGAPFGGPAQVSESAQPLVPASTTMSAPAPESDELTTSEPPEIATFPAVRAVEPLRYPLSQRTGEPRRPVVLMAAVVASWLSVAVTVVAFALWWWQASHSSRFSVSARLLRWTKPDPVSAEAIALVIIIGLIGLLMVAAAGLVAYNSWAGARWIRLGALVALVVTALSYLVTWWMSVAMIPLALAALLLWLPAVKRFFTAMAAFHVVRPVPVPTTNIKYGPQPLIGAR